MAEAVADPDRLFTQQQMLHLVSLAFGGPEEMLAYEAGRLAGYRQRVEEENAAYPPPPYLIVQGIRVRGDQAAARKSAAAADGERTDHPGGRVDDWGPVIPGVGGTLMHTSGGAASFPDLDGVSVRVRTVAGRCVWAEEDR